MIEDVTLPEGSAGPWKIERFTVSKEDAMWSSFRSSSRRIPPGTYTRLTHQHRGVVMSDTPAERRDHIFFVQQARGHVLINGLGLGMCLAAVLRKPEVERVTVIEIDADIIALVGPHFTGDPRVQIVHADAMEWHPPAGVRYGAVWHDIWDAICSDNLPEMARLHRRYGRKADWQDSWGKELCRHYRRGAR